MSRFIKHTYKITKEESGQATVEAALLLPVLLFLLALLLQPICIFYTRSVLASCAGETARILSTKTDALSQNAIEEFVMRRLDAIPPIEIFKVNDEAATSVSFEGQEGSRVVTVRIASKARPVPLLGVLTLPFTGSDGLISIEVEAHESVRSGWLEGGYDEWISAWQS